YDFWLGPVERDATKGDTVEAPSPSGPAAGDVTASAVATLAAPVVAPVLDGVAAPPAPTKRRERRRAAKQHQSKPSRPAPAIKSPRRRLPVSAILEVIAVLLILVFILLRLS